MFDMEAGNVKRILFSAAAGSLFMLSNGIVLAGHPFKSEPDRPQVSPGCQPNWGYHQTCWKRFGPLVPCDNCDMNYVHQDSSPSGSFGIYTPQSQFDGSQVVHSSNLPMSVLPSNANGSTGTLGGNTGVMSMPNQPGIPLPVPQTPSVPSPLPTPLRTPVPPVLQDQLNPMPAPPTGLPPIPSPLQQSRYGIPGTRPFQAVANDSSRYGKSSYGTDTNLQADPFAPVRSAAQPSPASVAQSSPTAVNQNAAVNSIGSYGKGSGRYGSGSAAPIRTVSMPVQNGFTMTPSGLVVPNPQVVAATSNPVAVPSAATTPLQNPSQSPGGRSGLSNGRYGQLGPQSMPAISSAPASSTDNVQKWLGTPDKASALIIPAYRTPVLRNTP